MKCQRNASPYSACLRSRSCARFSPTTSTPASASIAISSTETYFVATTTVTCRADLLADRAVPLGDLVGGATVMGSTGAARSSRAAASSDSRPSSSPFSFRRRSSARTSPDARRLAEPELREVGAVDLEAERPGAG